MSDETINVSRQTLEQIYKFYKAIKSADAIYKSCQNTQFRSFSKENLEAPNIRTAFENLKEKLKED